jgi:hypothetical protein
VNIQPRNVGLILGFLVEVSGTILNTAAAQPQPDGYGFGKYSQERFVHRPEQRYPHQHDRLALPLNSARQGFGFGGAYAPNLPMNFGNNYAPFSGPATIAVGANTAL